MSKYSAGEQEFKLLNEGFTFVFACKPRTATKPRVSLLEKTENKKIKFKIKFIFLKVMIGVNFSDSLGKNGNARFTMVPFEALSDQV